jgi:hypothetical protein
LQGHVADQPEPGSERGFGLLFAFVFLALAIWPLLQGAPLRLWALVAAAALLLVAIAMPAMLRVPNRLWFRFGLLLGSLVGPVVLAVIFFLAVVPIGLAMRALGKDPLRLKRDPEARSYWIERSGPMGSMRNQF